MDKRAQTIQSMFTDIAGSYDAANDYLSLGIHHLWKKKLISLSQLQNGDSVLDCATGTGDLALLFKKKVGPEGKVVGTDFCQAMLDEAPAKAKQQNLGIDFQWADVTALPFEDKSFDVSSISFGIRNVNDRNKALREIARVSKKNVMIREFGQIQTPVVRELYNFYSHKVLPFLGGLISGKPAAYQYLNDSSQVFPCGEGFKKEILDTGLYKKVDVFPLSFGVAYIYRCQLK